MVRPALLLLATLLAAVGAHPLAAQDSPARTAHFEIATGPYGGIYHPLGGALCRLYNRTAGAAADRCRVTSSAGSGANIEALRTGEAAFAIVQRDVAVAALDGTGPFADRPTLMDLRVVLGAHTEPVTVLVRPNSGIDALEDLNGKRLAVGVSSSGQRATSDALFAALGWSNDDLEGLIEAEPRAQIDALCDGQADAAVLVLGHPNGLVQRATTLCDAQILPVSGAAVEALVAGSGAYHAATIPGRIYGSHAGNIPSFGGEALLVTLADEPEERVYRLTRSIVEQAELLSRLHPALAELTAERLAPVPGLLPLHPGSSRYLRERGLIE